MFVENLPETRRKRKMRQKPGSKVLALSLIFSGSPMIKDMVRKMGRVVRLVMWSISTVERWLNSALRWMRVRYAAWARTDKVPME